MQPFDALTMRAVLQEATPLLINRKLEKVYQLGRDEVVIAFRSKTGTGHFLMSAQASYGRLCLVMAPNLPKQQNLPGFCMLLRKHLSGATIIGVEQLLGERVCDLILSCTDELGTRSTKVLTAEIMGRHSNLIFWDKDTGKILGASHVVTPEMSRQREVAPGLPYARPPQQEKSSVFAVSHDRFSELFNKIPTLLAAPPAQPANGGNGPGAREGMGGGLGREITTLEQWLLSTFSGMGRHLAEELIAATQLFDQLSALEINADTEARLWQRIETLQKLDRYRPAMALDLTRYSVLSWWQETMSTEEWESSWKRFPAANDMVEDYFRALHAREQVQRLRDRIRSDLKLELDKLDSRFAAASKQLETAQNEQQLKHFGDLILANITAIGSGQAELLCDDLNAGNGGQVAIALNPNLSASQNAQHYYRQYAKARVRKRTADAAQADAQTKLDQVRGQLSRLDNASTLEDLEQLRDLILHRSRRPEAPRTPPQSQHQGGKAPPKGPGSDKHPRLMSTRSSDGWLIYIGRNKIENDVLISKLAAPHDLWLHVQGQEGAHVLIKNPNKQDPPGSTLKEAAQLAARFSRVSLGAKVRVVYTHVKYVKKLGKDKPGMVRYENERTLEVDTGAPMPPALRKLFR
jgi:predicted ribosome quality control (RQC) complex YloA/Tae2 family protein